MTMMRLLFWTEGRGWTDKATSRSWLASNNSIPVLPRSFTVLPNAMLLPDLIYETVYLVDFFKSESIRLKISLFHKVYQRLKVANHNFCSKQGSKNID